MRATPSTLAALVAFASTVPALAQEAAHDHSETTVVELPAICLAGQPHDHQSGGSADEQPAHEMGEAQRAYMGAMRKTEGAMMAGMMHPDPDIAFLCGMIPHHQGAIEMAKVELRYGRSEAEKALAREIITAQEAEISDMIRRLEAKRP